jgi:RNA-binding protein YlmH
MLIVRYANWKFAVHSGDFYKIELMNNLEEQDLKLGDEASSLEEESFAEHKVITVDPGQGPERIDKYITGKFVKVSRNRVQNSIKAGAVTVNGKVIKSNYKVNPLDEIDVVIPRSMNGDTSLYAEVME